ncbi:MAG: YhjD/YihY/BrkB family envelope integrity protein, partial [Myxococcota bacterium]
QVLLWAAFGFLYWFFPNTRVRIGSAALGAFVAVVLFSVTRMVYVDLSVGAARYSVLFGGLVALPLVLTWIYLCWAVVLFGAEVAFAHQNLAHYRDELRKQALAPADRETQGARVVLAIARAFTQRDGPRTAEQLARDLDLPIRALREILGELEAAGLIAASVLGDREPGYLPSRPTQDTTLADVLLALRGPRRPPVQSQLSAGDSPGQLPNERGLDRVLSELDLALGEIAAAHTLADLVEASEGSDISGVPDSTERPGFGKAPASG